MSAPANPPTVGVGLVGAGFLARTRARCYARVSGGRARLVAVAASRAERAQAFAREFAVARWCHDAEQVLAAPDVDLVDLCVPNHLHRRFAEAAAAAGKHVVCTKPLAAYTGQDLPSDAADHEVAGRAPDAMLAAALADAQAMQSAADRAGVQLMYGENWLYAPAIVRAEELLRAAGASVRELRGTESHSGSHAAYARSWRHAGGGALLRLAAHPIAAMLHVKALHGVAPVAVSAELGPPGDSDSEVEAWGCAVLSFADGSRAVAIGSDAVLGGMQSQLEIMADRCRFTCRLSPVGLLSAYAPDGEVFAGQYLIEKAQTGAGWSTPMPDEDWTSGHQAMCEDFVRAAGEGRPARSTGALGVAVTRVLYSAYLAAAQGRRVAL